MKNLSLLLGLMSLLLVAQEPVAHAGQAMQPNVSQPPLRADCTAVQVAFKICRAPAPVVGGKQPATTQAAGQSQKQPVVAFPAAPVAAAPAAQQEFVPCQGVVRQSIQGRTVEIKLANLQNALNHIQSYDGKFQLCLDMNPLAISTPIIFNSQLDGEIIISGLKLTKAANFQEPLLDISSQQPVTITDSAFTNVTNGIRLSGAPHTLDHVAVSGDSAGECVIAEPEGAIIKNSTIDHCRIGLHVLAHNVALTEGSRVMQNGTGVYVDQGMLGFDVRDSFVFGNKDDNDLTSVSQEAIFYEQENRNDPLAYATLSADGRQAEQVQEQGHHLAFQQNAVPFLGLSNLQEHTDVDIFLSNPLDCGYPDIQIAGQPCGKVTEASIPVDPQVIQNRQVIRYEIGQAFSNKNLVFMLRDINGVYTYSKEVNLGGGRIVALGDQHIIVPAPVAAADGAQGGAPADPLSGPAAEGEAEEEVQVAFGGPNGADVGGPDFGPGGDLGGGNMGGAGGSAGDEVISAKDGAAESNSGHSGDKVAFGGDSDAVKIADSGFVTGGASGASGGCSLNPKTSSAPLTGILFVGTLLLAKTRRKLQKM